MTMSNSFTFLDLGPWNDLRRRAVLSWWRPDVLGAHEGWSLSKADPGQVLACFSELKLKPGIKLWAYQFKENDSGNGFVIALPAGSDPLDYLPTPEAPLPVSPVQLMSVLEGDATPQSYFQASLFLRECKELGALGHGINWLDHHLLTNDCWDNTKGPHVGYNFEPLVVNLHDWNWLCDMPQQFVPRLETRGPDSGPRLTFYTYHGRNDPRITRHEDVFATQGYSLHSKEETIALAK